MSDRDPGGKCFRHQQSDQRAKPVILSDIKEIRRRARAHLDLGGVTDGYRADRETVVRLLNEALATEIVCVLRYRRHHYMAKGIHATAVAEEFLRHSQEEQGPPTRTPSALSSSEARRTSTRPVSARAAIRSTSRRTSCGDDPRESRRGARRHRVLQ